MPGSIVHSVAGSEIARRIATIESRLGRLRPPAASSGAVGEPTAAGFDAFGSVYQTALAGIVGDGSTSSPDPAGWSAGPSTFSTSRLATATRVARPSTTRIDSASFGRTVGQVGGYGAMPVPAELAAYGNGNIPATALESIGQGGHRLWAPAAQDWRAAVAAAQADGVELRVTDSYRSYADQVQLAQDKGLYADGGLAAVPGTSNHGWGRALDVDVDNPAAMRWLQANGHRYGFVEAVTREPWHWEYRPEQA